MLEYENSLNPHENRLEGVSLLSRLCADTIAPLPEITKLARKIMRGSKVKPRDALHLACAESARCDYFVTCDDALIGNFRRSKSKLRLRIIAVNPVEFIRKEGKQYGES
jgi:predicted nucleic acid-binding protein